MKLLIIQKKEKKNYGSTRNENNRHLQSTVSVIFVLKITITSARIIALTGETTDGLEVRPAITLKTCLLISIITISDSKKKKQKKISKKNFIYQYFFATIKRQLN